MRTGEIRETDSKGRHTTTHREIIEINGVSFIDTPGLRELGMVAAEEGISGTFTDIAELISQCAFSDCTHRSEPGCAVRNALADGTLSPERWETYSRLEKENQWSKTKKNEMMMKVAMERRKLNQQRKKRGRPANPRFHFLPASNVHCRLQLTLPPRTVSQTLPAASVLRSNIPDTAGIPYPAVFRTVLPSPRPRSGM